MIKLKFVYCQMSPSVSFLSDAITASVSMNKNTGERPLLVETFLWRKRSICSDIEGCTVCSLLIHILIALLHSNCATLAINTHN